MDNTACIAMRETWKTGAPCIISDQEDFISDQEGFMMVTLHQKNIFLIRNRIPTIPLGY